MCDISRERTVYTGREKRLKGSKSKESTFIMDYLYRLAQAHESFRKPELNAIGDLLDIRFEMIDYRLDVR